MVDPEVFQKQMYCIEESTCDIVATFWGQLSVSAPVEFFLPCPPSYAPGLHVRIEQVTYFILCEKKPAWESFD